MAGKIGKLIVQNILRAQEPAVRPQLEPPPLPADHPRVYLTQDALAYLRQPQTCIYLGRRYGLTPQAPAEGLLDDVVSGAKPPRADSLAEGMNWLAGQMGTVAALRHLAECYSRLDDVDPRVGEELARLAPLAAGRVLVTVVAEDDVLTYSEDRPALTAALSDLLEYPWIVLGAERKADTTFYLQMRNVSRRLGMQQRPVFVVDPRPEEEVANEWPRAALRHVGLTPTLYGRAQKGSTSGHSPPSGPHDSPFAVVPASLRRMPPHVPPAPLLE